MFRRSVKREDRAPLVPSNSVDVHTVIAGRRFRFHFGRRRPAASAPHITDLVRFVTWLFFVATTLLPFVGGWLQTAWQPTNLRALAVWSLLRNTSLYDALLLEPSKVWRCRPPGPSPSFLAKLRRLTTARLRSPEECGQWWRLSTVVLTHGGEAHVQGNMEILKTLGYEAEARLGHIWFMILYLLSGLCGSIFSLYFTATRSCGASGAIYGLLGWRLGHLLMDTVFFRKYAVAVKLDGNSVGRAALSVEQSLDVLSQSKQHELKECWTNLQSIVLNEVMLALLPCVKPYVLDVPLLLIFIPDMDLVDHWAHLGGFLGGFCIGVCGKLIRPGKTSIYAELDSGGRPSLVATNSAYTVKVR